MSSRALTALALIATVQLAGCAAFRNYDTELQQTNQQLSAGNVDGALMILEKNNAGDDKDLLYYFEKGELLRSRGYSWQPDSLAPRRPDRPGLGRLGKTRQRQIPRPVWKLPRQRQSASLRRL